MDTVQQLYRADGWRVSRLHDMRGNRVSWREIAALPATLAEATAREVFGHRPELPWIPPAARRALARLLTRQSRVLEYGSGMSTLWLARRAAEVISVDHDREWAARVGGLARDRKLDNVSLHWLLDQSEYVNPPGSERHKFDLVIVDGIARPECAAAALDYAKPAGAIYLDNTDFGSQWQWYLDAEAVLLRAARERGGKVQYFTGFPPATFVASQSMLVTFG